MANTCCSSYTFYGKNEAMLKALNRFLENVVNDRRKGTNLVDGRRNLYDGIYAQHLAGIPAKEWAPARSEISTLDDIRVDLAGNYYFQMVANDAWSPQPEGWQAVLDKKFLGISLAYQGEEEGLEVYVYHDPTGLYYTDRYIVDAYLEGNSNLICEESEYFETEKDCLSFCKKKLKEFFEVHDTAFYMDDYTDVQAVKSLMNRSVEMLNDNERFAIHVFEEV